MTEHERGETQEHSPASLVGVKLIDELWDEKSALVFRRRGMKEAPPGDVRALHSWPECRPQSPPLHCFLPYLGSHLVSFSDPLVPPTSRSTSLPRPTAEYNADSGFPSAF